VRRIIIRFNAPVLLTFALLSLIALVLGNWTDGDTTWRYFTVYRSSLSDPLTYLRMFTHVLGHADYSHYMNNMLLLLLVGPGVEEKYGHRTTFFCIALTALITGLVQFVFFPATALLGASGIVFMMIVLSSFTEMRKEGIPITLILVVIFYLGGELLNGLLSRDTVSQLTHIIGGVCGLIFGFSIRGRRR
jgi:membrane associated rhomboid family serine protease